MTPKPAMFFVFGCPKSGTTWVQGLLDRHPEASGAGQRRRNTTIFGDIVGYAPFPEIAAEDERWLYEMLVARMLEKSASKPGVRLVGDKTPNLVEHLAWFAAMVPQARFIHVIRDARDVAVSGWHHLHRTATAAELRQLAAFREYALLSV